MTIIIIIIIIIRIIITTLRASQDGKMICKEGLPHVLFCFTARPKEVPQTE